MTKKIALVVSGWIFLGGCHDLDAVRPLCERPNPPAECADLLDGGGDASVGASDSGRDDVGKADTATGVETDAVEASVADTGTGTAADVKAADVTNVPDMDATTGDTHVVLLVLDSGSLDTINSGSETIATDVAADSVDSAETAPSASDTGVIDTWDPDVGTDSGPLVPSVFCGTRTCVGSEQCCATTLVSGMTMECTTAACHSGKLTVDCDGPEDCPGAAPICCQYTNTNSECAVLALGAQCAATCESGVTCPGVNNHRACHASSDCSEPGNTQCCEFGVPNHRFWACAGGLSVGYAVQCLPPS